jgi:sulfatase maturation enzyme AslB (radical SAM superfamily)
MVGQQRSLPRQCRISAPFQQAHLLSPMEGESQTGVTPWTVIPEGYGDFRIAVYEEWVHHDVDSVFVMNFEWALNAWIGDPSPVCIHAEQCDRSA